MASRSDPCIDLHYNDPTALHEAPKSAAAAYTAATALIKPHDALRRAGLGLHHMIRPRGPGTMDNAERRAWAALAYRFAGGGVVIDESVQWFTDPDTGKPSVRHAKFIGAKWAAAPGNPVERLIAGALAGPRTQSIATFNESSMASPMINKG